MKTLFLILFILMVVSAKQKEFISIPFGTNFQLKKSESGEPLTVAAFATDSIQFYLYDMADRSLAILDSNGSFIKKVPLQNIGRRTYTGDDFIVRKDEVIFLNAVDFKLEYFDIESGVLKKSLPYPREIPVENQQRRYRLVTRIFLDNSQIFLGNSHAVFLYNENSTLQKKASMKLKQFSREKSLLLFNTQNPVMMKSGRIEWGKKSAALRSSDYPFLGKHIGIVNKNLFDCVTNNAGITISRIDLAE